MEETKNKILNNKSKLLSQKLKIAYNTFLLYGIIDYNYQYYAKENHFYDPLLKLLSNFEDIQTILNLKEKDIFKFFYFNRKKVHYILYEEEEIINVDFNLREKNLSFYFYLKLLIKDNPNQINYIYSIDFINEVNNFQKMINDKKYQRIIISKIIIELIKNYKGTDEYKVEETEILNKIENDNKKIIEEIIYYINNIGLNIKKEDIYFKNVDEIYIEIINELMKQKKFENYEFVYNIINELDFENINITKIMLDNLNNILNSNEIYIKDYIITSVDDLSNEKINFNYILLKYLLKSSFYIYNTTILLKTRNIILNLLKSYFKTNITLFKNINPSIKYKLEYILEKLLDSKYYNHNITISKEKYQSTPKQYNHKNSISKEKYQSTPKHYNHKNSISKEKLLSISKISDFSISFQDYEFDIENYFIDSTYFIIINKAKDSETYEQKINFEYNNIKNAIKELKKDELNKDRHKYLYDNFNQLIKFVDKIEEKCKKVNNNDKKIELRLHFTENKQKEKKYFKNINCEYIINDLALNIIEKNNIYKDLDILNKDSNDENMINFNILFNKFNFSLSLSSIEKKSFNSNSIQNLNFLINALEVASTYRILSFLKIIGKNWKSANFLKETSIGLLICGWSNKIIFYNEATYKNEILINIDNHNIFEVNIGQEKEIELLVCSIGNKDIKRLIVQKDNNHRSKLLTVPNIKSRACFQFYKDYIICNEKGLFQLKDLFYEVTNTKEIAISSISYWNGIKINSNIVGLTSNKILYNGEDEIIFYNCNLKKIVYSIKNYSFTLSQNNLAIMPNKYENKNKILLCACKKYKKYQKNGILLLLLKLDLKKNINNIYKKFYDTKNFEVNCFCPIFEFTEVSYLDNKKNKKAETDYFLVGGLNKEKRKSFIKLYKLNYNKEDFEKTEIEYIQDIGIENNFKEISKYNGFKEQINFITQSKYNGNVFVGCSDGNVYLFSFQNIYSI